MGLFQKSVLSSYLESVSDSDIDKGWTSLQSYKEMATKIQSFKEEEFQVKFLEKIFAGCFGYKSQYDSAEEGNLFFEQKNTSNSKKADGAIKKGGEVIAIIELKSAKTKNLDDVKNQAYGYYNNNSKCEYVITSNFNKLRFYIERNEDYLEFDLFNIEKQEFKLLWLCLDSKNLLEGKPKEIKNKSIVSEENITKKLYQDYSTFRLELLNDLVKNNPNIEKKTILNKTQKLLDRILFILFAEDRGLLPINTISEIISNWETDNARGRVEPLYSNFIEYFNLINTGRPKRGDYDEIYSYNGGLFIKDDTLDSLEISNNILLEFGKKLTAYDFESEVSVDILGHIFEHSLSEIEELQGQLDGIEIDKSKSKRKKDGIYYTPKYITKYIVDNTLGKLCNEKKIELNVVEDDYLKGRKGRPKNKLESLRNLLVEYRKWLLELTICDPACGSGAFLNQALEFLIAEHNYIDELQNNLLGGGFKFPEVENSILENNLYGVDINDESVEIAKLSLWLRTAQKERKLTSLNNNIKCGNSLIDDPEVAGEKAFNWQKEFPDVFEKGGFDVVLGNPPYVRVQSLKENYFPQTEYLEETYTSASGKYDLYVIFMEMSYNIINEIGLVSFILPHKFLVADFGFGIRKFLTENKAVESIIHFGSEIVFNDASTYTCIINLQKKSNKVKFVKIKPFKITNAFKFNSIEYSDLNNESWLLKDKREISLFDKITNGESLKNICEGIYQGLITTGDDFFMVEGEIENQIFRGYSKALNCNIELESGLLKEVLKGQDIKRYLPLKSNRYVIYPHSLNDINKTVSLEEDDFKNLYPKTFDYLLNFKEHLIQKKVRYKTNPKYWYSLHRAREITLFEKDYLITPQLQNHPSFTVKETNVYADAGGYLLLPKKTFNSLELLPVLNSKILWYFIKNTSSEYSGGYFYFKTKYLEPFCIPTQRLKEFDFRDIVLNQLNQTKILFSLNNKFQRTIQRRFEIDKLPKKLQDWYLFTYDEFIKELGKKKIKLSLSEESKWEDFFIEESQKILDIKNSIDKTDKEIDQMVYELYGLTKEEIEIVENS